LTLFCTAAKFWLIYSTKKFYRQSFAQTLLMETVLLQS